MAMQFLIRPFRGLATAVPLLFTAGALAAAGPEWKSLFNGRALEGWDIWLGPKSGGYSDPKQSHPRPLGLNNDPLGVFTVVEMEGTPAIRVSGEVFGGITTQQEFDSIHMRVEYKWGEKKWPP